MLCNICHKAKATIHFKGVFNEEVFKMNLCEECAKNKGFEIKSEFVIPEIITALGDSGIREIKEKKSAECPSCGLKYSEFRQTGRLGCSNCYEVFDSYLEPLIKRIHGTGKYVGNKGCPIAQHVQENKQECSILKKKLNEAIKKEQYELAAELHKQLKEVEKNA